MFGRGGEEAMALAEAGLKWEVVPGVTSAIAAPAYAGIPVTHRGVSSAVMVVTGSEDPAGPGNRGRLGGGGRVRRHSGGAYGVAKFARHRGGAVIARGPR